jgi:cardiolipin synthase (CMP-forming)
VVVRDALIVGGAIAYHACVGHVEMAPSRISKLNTALEFLLLTSVLALSAGHVGDGVWLQALMFVTLVSIGLSGLHYVLVWGHKALRERGSHASPG